MEHANITPRDRLIVALDLPAVAVAEAMIARLGDAVTFYKIGYQLAYAGGLPLVRQLAGAGKKVFVDLKLHDIGNTVGARRRKRRVPWRHLSDRARLSADHEGGGRGARLVGSEVPRRHGADLYDDGDLHAAGYRLGVSDLVEARARQAQMLGIDGLVCSPAEASSLRKIVGHKMQLVTPGIRPAGSAAGDQKRIMTPARAIAAGADYLVVGRPVLEAADPRAAADGIIAEIMQALA